LLFALSGIANTGFGEAILLSLKGLVHFPLWLSSPMTTYTTLVTDYLLKSTFVYSTELSWARFFKYHTNAISSILIQIASTIILSTLIPYAVSYLIGVILGFLVNFAIASKFTFSARTKKD
jgi:putative flippase GtrA